MLPQLYRTATLIDSAQTAAAPHLLAGFLSALHVLLRGIHIVLRLYQGGHVTRRMALQSFEPGCQAGDAPPPVINGWRQGLQYILVNNLDLRVASSSIGQ